MHFLVGRWPGLARADNFLLDKVKKICYTMAEEKGEVTMRARFFIFGHKIGRAAGEHCHLSGRQSCFSPSRPFLLPGRARR